MHENDRPREKLKFFGANSLSTKELIAILIGSGYKGKNAIDLSSEVYFLLKKYINQDEITVEELMSIKGIGLASSSRIIAGLELYKRLYKNGIDLKKNIQTPEDIRDYFLKDVSGVSKEKFFMLLLDIKNRVISKELLTIGGSNFSVVDIKEIFKIAIKKGAFSICLVHNHPSGDSSPSNEDILITKRIVESSMILDINVLDHVIIGKDEIFSFKIENLI